MTYAQDVTAVLLDTDGTTVVAGDPLADSFGRTFYDELSGPGSGECMLSISDPGAVEVTSGRFVDIRIDGTSRFTFRIEGDPEYLVLGEGEEAEQVVKFTGRGWGAVLDTAIVYPEVDLSLNLNSPWRVFSFASPSFPNAGGWVAADELYEYLDGVTYGYRFQQATDGQLYPSPISFPQTTSPNFYDPAAPPGANYVNTYWIWPPTHELDIGYAFFRRTLTIAADGIYVFAITADNFFTLFLEGVPILGEQTDHFIWQGWKEVPIFLPAGSYQVAVAVENYDINIVTNPAGLIMTVHTLDGNQLPDSSALVTDLNWVCDFDADYWPGWTPGQIFDKLFDEAVARGALSAFDTVTPLTFAALTDSASNAWADTDLGSQYIPAFAAENGSTIMAALGKAVDEGHIEWHAQPGTLRLDVWAPGSIGAASGVSLVAGTNLASLTRGATAVYANALLVQWERGYVEVSDAAEIAAFGDRVEDIYSSEASTDDEASRIGRVELDQRIASGWPAVVAGVEPTSSADAPYTGFDLGETVTIPAIGGGTEVVPVRSFKMVEDGLGRASWICELNRQLRVTERTEGELLREIGGRSGYSTGTVR